MAAAAVDERGPTTVQLHNDEQRGSNAEAEVSAGDRQRFKSSSELQQQQQQQQQQLADRQQKSKASVSLLARSLNYPPPTPPNNRRSRIFRSEDYILIDEHALSVPVALLHQSTEVLMHYLCPSPLSELARLRSIYRWMSSFRLEDLVKDQVSADGRDEATTPQTTPLEHLQRISSQTTNYAAVFTQLARSVGLRCLTIPGLTKSSAYTPGDAIDRKRLQGQWNAVHVNGDWHLIDVYWTTATASTRRDDNDPASSSSSSQQQQPWTRLQLHHKDKDVASAADDDRRTDEHHGQQQQQQQQEEEGKVFNEFFFLPDPDQFVLTHLPDEDAWQLVDRSRIWTQDKFENYLYIRERFFELNMQLLPSSKTNCVIETTEGKAVVVFGLPSKRSKSYRFTYILFRHKSDYDPAVHSLLFERYSLLRKTRDRIELAISFPVTGRFLLNMYGKEMEEEREQDFSQLCSYVIDCKSPAANVEPLPDCPDIGWGPGSELEAVGVVPRSHTKPVIETENGELELEFGASDLKVALLHLLSDEVDEWHGGRHAILMMRQQHQQQQNKKKKKTVTLAIKLQLPKPGIYAVKLFATNLMAEGDIPNVVNYLVKYPDKANSPSSSTSSSSSIPSSPSSCKPFPVIHEGIVGRQYLSSVFSVTTSSTFDLQRIVMTSDGKLDVGLTKEMDDAEFLFHLNNIELREIDLVDSCSYSAFSARETKLSLNLPQSGQYALNIFVRLSRRDASIYVVQTQLIQSTQMTSLPVQGRRRSNDEDDRDPGGGMIARRGLVTGWSSSLVNVWRNGLMVTQTLTVYQTPVVFATAISDQFQIKMPPGDHPLVAELQKETAILFPQSHRVSKVLRKDYELFTFQVSQNGMYRIDFYECLASGALMHLATYSITRRNPSEQEPKVFKSATEPYEDMAATTEQQDSAKTESTVIPPVVAADDKQRHVATPAVIQKQISKETVIKKADPPKSSERLKPQKPTKKKSVEKKEDEVPKTVQASVLPIETKTDASQLQNNESESKAEPIKDQPIQREEPQETDRKVEELTERDVKENPPPIIVEEYKSKTSVQEDSHPTLKEDSHAPLQDDSYTPVQEDIITEPVMEKEHLTVEPDVKPAIVPVVHIPLKEKAMKLIPKPFRKRDKQTEKPLSAKDLKSAKKSENKAKQKSSAQKLDDERKLLESSLRAKLEEAMKGTDVDSIQQVLDEINSKKLTLSLGDITRQAAKRIECLRMADKLRNAVKARDEALLRKLVAEAKKEKLERSGMADEMKMAEDVIDRLEAIRRLTQMIVDMDRQLVAEVKSYHSPRPPVYNVIAATFMLLGEPQANIKDWKSVQHLFIKSGSDSLKQRVNSFDLQNIDIGVAIAAENLFRSFKRHEVERISTGIAIFYDWNAHVVDEVKSLYVQSGGNLHQVRGYREHHHHPGDDQQQQQQSASGQRRLSPASHRFPFPIKSHDENRLLSPSAPTQDHHKQQFQQQPQQPQQRRRSSASSSASSPHRQTRAEQHQPQPQQQSRRRSSASSSSSASPHRQTAAPEHQQQQQQQQQRPPDRHRRLSASSAAAPADRGRGRQSKRRTSLSPSLSPAAAARVDSQLKTKKSTEVINDQRHLSTSPSASLRSAKDARNKIPPSASSASASDQHPSPPHPPPSHPPPPQQQQQGRRKSSDSRRDPSSTSSASPSHKVPKKMQ